MKWISVKDQLPEEWKWVLVIIDDDFISIAHLLKTVNSDIWDTGDNHYEFDEVTYWMPLPELPKNVDEAG